MEFDGELNKNRSNQFKINITYYYVNYQSKQKKQQKGEVLKKNGRKFFCNLLGIRKLICKMRHPRIWCNFGCIQICQTFKQISDWRRD
ncbi:unnamed protein product [Paramecium sonneborni]|uniref:Uncharacterized protein n=1 Tax=Paramecium sonneborni TaxID=65129 RepID=A0A8S1MYQ1_9CILI|nr:unnamed protein product [Paramecium sonneborni]